jgi:hypothetical protein
MKKADNFDSSKWLVENKITTQSRLNEDEEKRGFYVTMKSKDGLGKSTLTNLPNHANQTYSGALRSIERLKDINGRKGKKYIYYVSDTNGNPLDKDGNIINEESRLNEDEDLFTYNNRGQGSGSDSKTQKGTPISVNDIEPEMNVIISYDFDSGQGSGSQGTETLSGKVKSVTSDKVFISIDDAKLNKYTKKYQAMYKRDGKGISKRNITKITTL